MLELFELPAKLLRRICDINQIGCESSLDVEILESVIGQERALQALKFGLEIKAAGFNIFVAGLPGTGRTTAVKRYLEEAARGKATPGDWCYVNNFHDPSRPNAIQLPSDSECSARKFQAEMKQLIENVERDVRKVFESEEYAAKKEETSAGFEKQKGELISKVNEKAQQAGFIIQQTPIGLVTVPLHDGQPLSQEAFISLGDVEKRIIADNQAQLQSEIESTLRQIRNIEKSSREALSQMDRQFAEFVLSQLMENLREKFKTQLTVLTYLNEVSDDILVNLDQFREEQQTSSAPSIPPSVLRERFINRYSVNVLVDNTVLKGQPVIIELNPTYNNLFGRIENEAQYGTLVTDFTLIRKGSLHLANGGYLVISAEELLRTPFAWDNLKRAFRNKEIGVEDISERIGILTTRSLHPAPIPLDVKVILIGQPSTYHLLYAYDEDFPELFKVKADFDSQMERTESNIRSYASFARGVCDEEFQKHLDAKALGRLVEFGSRLANDQDKLSTRFGEIADVIREAGYYAASNSAECVTIEDLNKAVEARFYRSNLIRDRIHEMIRREVITIEVTGERIGQINGLSVIDMGDISFGQPSRITVSVGIGNEGVVDIEREAKTGGSIHTKGVQILSGFFIEKFAQTNPINLSARLVFEQNYSGVEGDSASSAELYGLLSALAELPISQCIAVTGSVDQKGNIQAIGGVNEKIEGFFDVCKIKGFNGKQGVIIPRSNIHNLMLKDDVVQAVLNGIFHVWAVDTVEEGIELLTGVNAGERGKNGGFEENSVYDKVSKRLISLGMAAIQFGKSKEKSRGRNKFRYSAPGQR